MTRNRARLARERAGLSVGQACTRLGGIERDDLLRMEMSDDDFFGEREGWRAVMADVYGVNPEWLAGEVPRHDYAAVDRMNGADKLTFHDRDVVAEFAAAMPRGKARRP